MKQFSKIRYISIYISAVSVVIIAEPWQGDDYEIMQYASGSGNQAMFYTISDKHGNLAVIDGGYDTDAQQVADTIKRYGGHVHSWVITHPHPDHVGAFNKIYPNAKKYGIKIDHVYATSVNHDRYLDTARDYDDPEAYVTFYNQMKNAKNVTYLKENDKLELLPGLRMKVIHGWDSEVDSTSANLCNNGSLMFKIYGRKESMLFCADTQEQMEKSIIDRHGSELKSDYVQCGHHGNWGMTIDFYKKVGAKAAFMDGPDWLYQPSDNGSWLTISHQTEREYTALPRRLMA